MLQFHFAHHGDDHLIFSRGLQSARPATNILHPNTAQPIYGKLTSTIKIKNLHDPQSSKYVIVRESVAVQDYVYFKRCCVPVTSIL